MATLRSWVYRVRALIVERNTWVDRLMGLVALTAATYIGWQLSGVADASGNSLVNNAIFIPVFAVGVLFALRSAVAQGDRRTRRAWLLMTAAYVCTVVGNVVWLILENVLHREPFPSWADAAYLSFYPLLFLALLEFPRGMRGTNDDRRLMLDAATVFVGGAMVIWYFVIRSVALVHGSDVVATVVGVAYPVADLVLVLGLLTVAFRGTDDRSRPALMVLSAGVGVLVVADLLFAYLTTIGDYESGGVSYVTYMVSDLLLILAPYWYLRLSPMGARPDITRMRRGAVNLLPYLGIAVGYGILLLAARDIWRERLGGLIGGAVLLTLLVVARQVLSLRDHSRSEARFRSLVQNASDLVCVVDRSGAISYISPSVERLLDYEPEAVLAQPAANYVHSDDLERIRIRWHGALDRSMEQLLFEIRVRNRAGEWEVMEALTTHRLDDPAIQGIVINGRLVTERKRLEARLRHQAFHDALTGLPNRANLTEVVTRTLAGLDDRDCVVAILFLDLDGFKVINDSLGHAAGDAMLRIVAERLSMAVGPDDHLARFGGDEFAVLLCVADADEALAAAERFRSSICAPVSLGGRELVISVSVGIGMADARTGIGAEELLRRADIAMYQAKATGKDRVVLFDEALHSDALPRLELETELRRALVNREFEVHYQPELDLTSGRIVGVEALVRWMHPRRGLLAPGAFIELAEETGLIVALGRQVLQTACRDWREWQSSTPDQPPLQLSVNLSPRQLADPALVDDVAAVLRETKMDPSLLWLELTESTVMVDTPTTQATLLALRDLGVRLALDDFGTGFSSLSHLSRIPVGMLKIDRSFVAALDRGGPAPAVIHAVTTLAGTFNMRVVAEGVETAEQLDQVRALGCDWVQGYYIGRPMPATALSDALIQQPDSAAA